MGTIACSVILNRMSTTLLDKTGVRWLAADTLASLNAGLSWLSQHKPDVFVKNEALQLVAGSLQALPAGGIQLRKVTNNMGSDGTTVGKPIRPIERNELDTNLPDWLTTTGTAVEHYTHDPLDPKRFDIFPLPTLPWYVRVVYAASPTRVTSASDTLPVDDLYENTLHDFGVGYSLLMNSKSGDTAKGAAFINMAAASIGVKTKVQFDFAPPDPEVATKTGADL